MKKLFIFASLLWMAFASVAGVRVEIIDGIDNPSLQRKMEQQTEALLNAFDAAAKRNGDINFTGISVSDIVAQSISSTWNQIHFSPEDVTYVEPIMTLFNGKGRIRGYQIRNIGVTVVPIDDKKVPWERQELCIDFSTSGNIASVNFTMSNVQYANALREAQRLEDGHERMQILNWCERFAQYYMDKDIASLQAIFAEDALIISGKVIVGKEKSTVRYTSQTVQEYLTKLAKIFKENRYVGVDFDQYEIKKHPHKSQVYIVTLRQRWTTNNYADLGTLTLVWDFSDEDFPRIQARVWSPLGVKPFNINTIPFYD